MLICWNAEELHVQRKERTPGQDDHAWGDVLCIVVNKVIVQQSKLEKPWNIPLMTLIGGKAAESPKVEGTGKILRQDRTHS